MAVSVPKRKRWWPRRPDANGWQFDTRLSSWRLYKVNGRWLLGHAWADLEAGVWSMRCSIVPMRSWWAEPRVCWRCYWQDGHRPQWLERLHV